MNLKELRQQSKKTAAEVAAALGVARSTYSNYEQGTRQISLEQVFPLTRLFDVTEREVIEAQLESISKRAKRG